MIYKLQLGIWNAIGQWIDRSNELELLALLGEGSFGHACRARHKATDAVVAVKVVLNSRCDSSGNPMPDSEMDKIMGEIDRLSRCDSPFIVGYCECLSSLLKNKRINKWKVERCGF